LAWHFDKRLVVIEHGKMPLPAASDPMAKQSEAVFHILQKNSADRFETWTSPVILKETAPIGTDIVDRNATGSKAA